MDLEKNKQRLEILATEIEELKNGGGGGATTDYNDLTNKPSINSQVLTGNKSLADLGAATPSDITEAFTPSGITIVEGGTFPSGSRTLLTEHKPIMVNNAQYYFLEESGVDYLYGSLPTSGAYPSISYFRVMKQSFEVEFHDTAIDTAPTEDSTNLITSGAVYDAVQGGGNYISKDYPIIGGTLENNSTVDNKSIAIGYNNGSQSGYLNSSIVLGQCDYVYNSSFDQSIVIGASKSGYPSNTIQGGDRSVIIGEGNTLKRTTCSTVIGQGVVQRIFGLDPQLSYSTILGSFPKLTNPFVNNIQRAFIVGAGEGGNDFHNTVEVKGEDALRIDRAHLSLYNGADISFTGDSEFKVGSDTNSYDLRYFAPADETLTDGGTISATALANALKHVPLSFNAHLCYYSYEDTNNVYYVSTRLNGTSLHTNVVAINKTTGVATFNEFDQS